VSVVRQKDSKNELTLDLEGHFMPQWFRLMEKTLDLFQKDHPDALTQDEIENLTDTFKQNSTSAPADEIIDRIQKRLPTIVQAGFGNEESGGHAVTFLFFDDHFIICNRGAGAEKAVDIYRYDPKKLDLRTFIIINMVKLTGGLEDYERLISEILPDNLNLSKTEYEEELEARSGLDFQTIGNCSFISPITSVFAFLLFSNLKKTPPASEVELDALQGMTVEKYAKWLEFLQLTILERLITPLTDPNRTIIPDHRFIRKVLKNAHTLVLDKTNEKKLDEITIVYQETLGPREARFLKTELVAWKNLPKNPAL
jgi:hypothetical protein